MMKNVSGAERPALPNSRPTALPPDPKFEATRLNGSARWPENQLYYAIPFCSIQPHKLIDSPDIDTGQMLLVMVMSAYHLHQSLTTPHSFLKTNLLSFLQGHVPGSTDGSELVVWLSGHKMDSTLAQRIHAAELLDVDPVQSSRCTTNRPLSPPLSQPSLFFSSLPNSFFPPPLRGLFPPS
ncbi:hypothetical protein BS47DRAFT_959394 [Hydnum rufescens UP504]|uniref:Uncharacterized protein n=1 Tax=Hydnum rufescens UP504 TaxID=1448309 RepID=A0A9P6AZ86_9AGAM|nr:hypothetical protein BS47DRAFT_959394 [Hydnum rufescens UP504]